MNIAHQFQKIGILLAENGLKTVLKQVTVSSVALVIPDGITREKPSHQG
jgi:hypothetical protein